MHENCTLLHGDWRTMLDVVVDSTISDPPFSETTHDGHDALEAIGRATLGYTSWTEDDVHEFVRYWAPRTRGWMACFTDDNLIRTWKQAYREAGRYYFASITYVHFGARPRMQGDGPSNWSCHIMVSRPRSEAWLTDWRRRRKAIGQPRSLDGTYDRKPGDVVWTPPGGGKRIGGKPLGVMRRLVEDYSFFGDVVCDPCAGHGTTLRAAIELGRSAIGCERDREVWAQAISRLRQPIMFAPTAPVVVEQTSLFGR